MQTGFLIVGITAVPLPITAPRVSFPVASTTAYRVRHGASNRKQLVEKKMDYNVVRKDEQRTELNSKEGEKKDQRLVA